MPWPVGGLAWLISTALFWELRVWFKKLDGDLQAAADGAITNTMARAFVIPLVAGAVGLASSLMSRERLFR